MKYPLQFDGILVIVVPVVVEKVPLKVLSMVGSTALLESIARCVRPNLQTKPAELVSAFAAGHVVAAAIFLDKCIAFRALFSVDAHPI